MAKPSKLPEWDTTQVNSIEPDQIHKDEGWLAPGGVPEKPPFQTFNYWQNEVYRWLDEINIAGILAYDTLTDYIAGISNVIGSDGNLYICWKNNGPTTAVVDPVGDVTGVWSIFETNIYRIDASETDQGVTGNGRTIKAFVDAIGTSKNATLIVTHNGIANTTSYTLTTNITIPSNITLEIENGAIFDGVGILTIAGSFKNTTRNKCFEITFNINFSSNSLQEFAYPEWWGENTIPGTTDMTAEIKAAIAALETNLAGGTVSIGHGTYQCSSTISLDRSTDSTKGRISIKGMGTYSTRVNYSGPGALFIVKNHHTDAGENISQQSIEDMTLWGTQTPNSSGIAASLAPYLCLRNLMILAFDYGLYFEDVDQSYFERLWLQGNIRGLYSAIASPPGAASTHPNNLTFIDCHFSENLTYGAYFIGHSNVNFYGGAFENNGKTTPGWAIKAENAGKQGDVGLNCNSVYFEGNEGQADIIIVKNDGISRTLTHSFVACGFKRLSNLFYTTNNIYADLDDPSTDGLQIISLINCGFSGYNTYVPDAGRPYVNFVNGITQDNFVTVASVFESSIEAPPTNERWNTIALDAGTGGGAFDASLIDMPALYQFDIDSLTASKRLDLPAASTCVGYEFIVYLINSHATYSLIVQPDGTDQIIGTSAAGDYIHSKTADTYVHLIALAPGKWGILNADGLPTGWAEE